MSNSSICGISRCRFSTKLRSPAWAPSQNEVAQRWQKKVDSLDGFIFTAAEYNRGPTAVLKNALDYAYKEWNQKPVAFVGYGGVGGARAVEQLAAASQSSCRWRRSGPPSTSCSPTCCP